MSKTKQRSNNAPKRVRPSGWSTSDADEIERRRLRGINEAIRVEFQAQDSDFFGIYRTHSVGGQWKLPVKQWIHKLYKKKAGRTLEKKHHTA